MSPCLLACVFSVLGLTRRRRVVVVILSAAMYLMYYVNENGDKVYTLKVSVLFSLLPCPFLLLLLLPLLLLVLLLPLLLMLLVSL